jgi:hypothetical protein
MALQICPILGAKGPSMKSNKLPFDLKESDLAHVEITYRYHSQKLNAGFQEISVSGKGKIQLRKTLSANERPEILEGAAAEGMVVAMLEMIEEANFLGLEEEYPPGGGAHGYRKIMVKLPKASKTVTLYEPGSAEFENIAGAIKVVAGTAIPSALGHRFFPNL